MPGSFEIDESSAPAVLPSSGASAENSGLFPHPGDGVDFGRSLVSRCARCSRRFPLVVAGIGRFGLPFLEPAISGASSGSREENPLTWVLWDFSRAARNDERAPGGPSADWRSQGVASASRYRLSCAGAGRSQLPRVWPCVSHESGCLWRDDPLPGVQGHLQRGSDGCHLFGGEFAREAIGGCRRLGRPTASVSDLQATAPP